MSQNLRVATWIPTDRINAGGDPETAPDHVFMAFIIRAR